MVVTPNPFTDAAISPELAKLDRLMHSELRVYKGNTEPSKVQLAATYKSLNLAFKNGLYQIGMISLEQGCREVNVQIPSSYKLELMQQATSRAAFASKSILDTTSMAFGLMHAALSKKGALGKKRSKSASQYEGSRIFFEQRTKAWRLKFGVMKGWYTASDPCDICQDNEDEGKIPMDQEFPSGDLFPPAHLNCLCLMSLIL